jgi:hypothetical protein
VWAVVREMVRRYGPQPGGSNGDLVERFTRCFVYFLEAASRSA